MGEKDSSKSAPLLLRNLIASVFIFAADKVSLINFGFAHGSHRSSKLLRFIRYVLVSSLLFFLRLFLIVPSNPIIINLRKKQNLNKNDDDHHQYPPPCSTSTRPSSAAAANNNNSCSHNSGIGRALWQVLSLVNDIPVSSRKYQAVRSLAETIIHDNHKDGVQALRQVNRTVLSKAFYNTLCQLEAAAAAAAVLQQQQQQQQVVLGSSSWSFTADSDSSSADSFGTARQVEYRLSWLLRAVIRSICGNMAWITTWGGGRGRTSTSRKMSAEKLAAEVLWLAEKLAACGYGDEAVGRWASAANLAWLSLSIEPALQASFVKVSALLFKHAKDMGILNGGVYEYESKKEQQKQTKVKMLMSWLPLLCRASNGADVPVLSIGERAELERVLEETIEMLEVEDQEKVLSLWLHHFTYCSSSDWPNLNACYAHWCNASRKLLLDQHL